jgi:YaiO family outer membrane protein
MIDGTHGLQDWITEAPEDETMMFLLALSLVSAMADGDIAMARGDYAAAAQYYRAEVAAHPDAYEAKFNLARCLSFSDHRDEAIRLYTELLETRSANSDLLLARGRTYAWEGRWHEAEADLKTATTRSPDNGDAWSALGDLYQWSDRYLDAAKAYGTWIAVDPGNPRAYVARARARRSAGDIDAARADFEAARAHGAPGIEIDRYLASLQQRRQEQEAAAPAEYTWLAGLSYDLSRFSTDRSDWRSYGATIRRYWKQWSLGFEYLGSHEFATTDHALALDAYADLWQRAYANVRYQYSPQAALYPDDAYRVEVFQGVGKGWELSASYDHMDFGDSNVAMYGVGLGKYTGDWYLRWRALAVPSSAGTSISHRALGRYYYAGNGDDYLEMNAGFGRGGEFLNNTAIIATTRSRSIGAAFQTYFLPQWGTRISAGRSENDEQRAFVETSVSVKLMRRW